MAVSESSITDLTGRVLIAMPGMGDPRFDQSVVLLCDHSDQGAMGIIINKPNDEIDVATMLGQLSIDVEEAVAKRPVHFGGPVETGRGFVLHSGEYSSVVASLDVLDGVKMTGTLDVLEDIGSGSGPDSWLLALGYAGWGPGQLESEISQNAWLTSDADAKLVFATQDSRKWERALDSLGITPLALSSEAGRA